MSSAPQNQSGPVPARSATKKLLALAALPVSPARDAEMLRLHAAIEASEFQILPSVVRGPTSALGDGERTGQIQPKAGILTSPSPAEILQDAENIDPMLVERLLSDEVLLPFIRYLLDADGRGAFNVEAIALRVTALAWLLDPAILLGASERKLAAELGVCAEKLSRAVRTVSDQLHLSNNCSGEFQRAARKSAATFGSITKRSKPFHVGTQKPPSLKKAA